MKWIAIKPLVVIFLVLFLTSFANAQYRFELTPSLTISETYDDNIYLDPNDKVSSYITTISPSIHMDLSGENMHLGASYTPSPVWYSNDGKRNDTINHSASLTFDTGLSEHLGFNLSDTYIKSNEPIETIDTIVDVRHTRRSYQRNTGSASINYSFGPEDSLTLGYSNSLLKNDDPSIDDGLIQTPHAAVTVWMNEQNGLEFNYTYTDAHFWREDGSTAGEDYTGHSPGVRYIYRFNPHQECFVGYTFTSRNFDDTSQDYKVHNWSVGYNQDISQNVTLSLGVGYFKQDRDISSGESGVSYNASITRQFNRGSVTIGGTGGWHEAYLEAQRTGFSKYQSVNANVEYQLLEALAGYAAGSFQHDKDDADRKWNTYSANFGLRWSFLRWFSAGLSYGYEKRSDDVQADEYTDNRVMLTVTGSRLFRW